MHTLTDRDLQHAPEQVMADARCGKTASLAEGGTPAKPGLALTHSADTRAALIDLAATLYEAERMSLGRVAEVVGPCHVDMLDDLGRCGIAAISLKPDELELKLAAFGL
jgi:hypothetical protein